MAVGVRLTGGCPDLGTIIARAVIGYFLPAISVFFFKKKPRVSLRSSGGRGFGFGPTFSWCFSAKEGPPH